MLVHVNKTMHKVTDDVASDNINSSTSSRAGITAQFAEIIIKDASVQHGGQPESAVVAFPSREDIFMCVFARTGADRRYKVTLTRRESRRRNPIDQSMLFPGMILLVGHRVLREERDADARRCRLGKDDARFFQSVLMIYTWKSCITLIHVLVSIKRCEEAPRHFTTIMFDLIPLIEKIAVRSDEAMIITEA